MKTSRAWLPIDMSVRRRAIRERVERQKKFMDQWRIQDDALKTILALVKRKIAAGDTNVTAEELMACMPDSADQPEGGGLT